MRRILISLIFVSSIFVFFLTRKNSIEYEISGQTMGTIQYNVKYISEEKRISKSDLDSILINFNNIFSTYIPNSEISIVNESEGRIKVSKEFGKLITESNIIYKLTDGMFDPTVGPLVNDWGFGPGNFEKLPSKQRIQELLQYVGFDKISYEDGHLHKKFKKSYIDFSSIAKGYAVDLIHDYLKSKNIENTYIEIGGEVRVSGVNKDGNNWVLGILEPSFDKKINLSATVSLANMALATSGNYMNNYYVDDSLFFHTINPKTGLPAYTNMLSASVFSSNCLSADAYATAFMAMNFIESKSILDSSSDLLGYIIYKEKGEVKIYISDELKPYIRIVEKTNSN
ncbi:MAG: thiamine biosynthesis protein ApbE [Flammeovirgaceae bacterium]|jgi:thiamine biosynthesis lipoprotein|nr:thiamine biosynthesis protein ApbE [Flammeovirgaceae bacterium]